MDVLPARQKVGIDGERRRLHLLAQDRQRAAVDLLERAAVEVFGKWRVEGGEWSGRSEAAFGEFAVGNEAVELGLEPVNGKVVTTADVVGGHRAGVAQVALEDAAGGVGGLVDW